MRAIKIVTLGLVIWSLSLLWPEINKVLTLPVTAGLVLGLAIIELIYSLERHLKHNDKGKRDGTSQNHPAYPLPAVLPR